MKTSLVELRRASHTSVSAIKTFLTCPRRYFLQYVLKEQPSFRPAALVFGSAWHETIGKWLLDDEVHVGELRQHLRDGLLLRLREENNVLFDDAEQSEDGFLETAGRMLDVFLSNVTRPEKTLGTEIAFSMALTHSRTGEVLPVPLIGALDAVVIDQGKGAVWELKSAKKKWTPDQLEFDLQATAYGMAARHEGYDGAALELLITTKAAKPVVQRETVLRHRCDEEELVDIALGVHRAVEAGVDYPNRGWQCRTCPFASACRP